jgi:hypothetical protein
MKGYIYIIDPAWVCTYMYSTAYCLAPDHFSHHMHVAAALTWEECKTRRRGSEIKGTVAGAECS